MLAIKKKHLDRREWYEECERDFSCMYQKDEFFEGGIGLITFTDIKEPSEVNTEDGKLCIADRGYQWLELVPKDGHCALTAMFYKGALFQMYVDITLKNDVFENGDAEFSDLFLDVVIRNEGEPTIVDENELEEAFRQGVITQEQYELAKASASEIVEFYHANKELVREKIVGYLQQFTDKPMFQTKS